MCMTNSAYTTSKAKGKQWSKFNFKINRENCFPSLEISQTLGQGYGLVINYMLCKHKTGTTYTYTHDDKIKKKSVS